MLLWALWDLMFANADASSGERFIVVLAVPWQRSKLCQLNAGSDEEGCGLSETS